MERGGVRGGGRAKHKIYTVLADRFISNFTAVLAPSPCPTYFPPPRDECTINTLTPTLDIEAREFSTNILIKRLQSFTIMSFLYIAMYLLAFLATCGPG